MPIHCRWYNYMLHAFPEVTLRSTRHKVMLHGLQKWRQNVKIIRNVNGFSGHKWKEIRNRHLLYNKIIVDLRFGRHEVLLYSKLNHIDLRSAWVNITFIDPCPIQHESIIVYKPLVIYIFSNLTLWRPLWRCVKDIKVLPFYAKQCGF